MGFPDRLGPKRRLAKR